MVHIDLVGNQEHNQSMIQEDDHMQELKNERILLN